MQDKCEVILEKDAYRPGEVLNGIVECEFKVETKIKATLRDLATGRLRWTGAHQKPPHDAPNAHPEAPINPKCITIKIGGEGRVSWKASRYSYRRGDEIYLELESELLSGEITIPPGSYKYPFFFTLPNEIPSSMSIGDPTYKRDVASFLIPLLPIDCYYGAIEYAAQATVKMSWSTNVEAKKPFTVYSHYDLAAIDGLEKPLEISKAVRPASLLKESGPIKISVQLPMGGFLPSQVVSFSMSLKNESTISVQYVQFKFVQGFTFHALQQSKSFDSFVGEEFVVKDSSVAAGNEKTWELELEVPAMALGNSGCSNIIKMFWELRGEVSLPIPHYNFNINIPITLGAAPSAGITL